MKAFLFSYVLFDYILIMFRNGWNYKHITVFLVWSFFETSQYCDDWGEIQTFAKFTKNSRNCCRYCKFYNMRFSCCVKDIYPGTPDFFFSSANAHALSSRRSRWRDDARKEWDLTLPQSLTLLLTQRTMGMPRGVLLGTVESCVEKLAE
jgi:hypothetical protein